MRDWPRCLTARKLYKNGDIDINKLFILQTEKIKCALTALGFALYSAPDYFNKDSNYPPPHPPQTKKGEAKGYP